MKNFEKWTLVTSGVAIIISIVTLFRECSQDDEIGKLQYEVNANNYKPIIKIDSVTLTDINEHFGPFDIQKDINDISDLPIKVKSEFRTKATFHLENIGNSNALIISSICIDTISGNEKIRELFYNNKIPLKIDSTNGAFYKKLQIQPEDKKDITFTLGINFFKDNEFAIHLLIIYYNDMGILYDTYYWIRFKKKDLNFIAIVDTRTNEIVGLKLAKNDFNNYVTKIDDNNAYKIYTKKDKEKFEKVFEQMKNNAR